MAGEIKEKPRVLLVDDEQLIVRCLARFLREICEVFTAESYDEAERVMLHGHLDAVVSDCRMPGRGGADVLSASLVLQPDALRVMYSSAAPSNLDQLQETNIVERFVDKPGHNELKAMLATLPQRILDKAS